MADLRIDLAAEFSGKKVFRDADRSVLGLQKNVEKLGRTLGIALSTAAIIRYGKESVKAFAADEAATIRLSNAVTNLGLAYANPQITKFIDDLERTAGIADDVLRPAFQALLTTTKDLGASYTLLNNAITISRGSGIDLATVAQDLANGYVGITRGLKKYNLGLTQNELKTKSFTAVLTLLNKQFAGANQAYLDSYSFKLDALTVAGERAKEVIGKGLIDAFARAGGGSDVQDAINTIDNIAKAINGITQAVGFAIGGLTKLYRALDFITSFGGLFGENGKIVQKFAPEKLVAATKATTQTQIKATTVLAKATTKNTAELKKQAALKKAGSLFDLEQIQIIAALKNNISAEERKRLELQFALLTGNEDQVKKLTYELAKAQGLGEQLARFLADLPAAKNPFASWDAYLDMLAAKARSIVLGFGSAPQGTQAAAVASGNAVVNSNIPLTNVGTPFGQAGSFVDSIGTPFGQAGGSAPAVVNNITVQGSIIREQELIDKVLAGTQLSSLSGSPSQIGRIAGMFG